MHARQIVRILLATGLLGLIGLLPIAAQAATVATITLTTPHTTLDAGVSETLTASAKDSAKHTVSGIAFTWSSSSTSVLSITSKGVVKGLKPGTSTVKVTGGGKSASVAITVTTASIALTTPDKSPHIGDQETLTAVAKDSGGHSISGVKFTWSSSKTDRVSINRNGLAKALEAGSSVITVTGGGKSATVTIKVPVPTGLAGVAAKGAAIVGATITLVDKKGATATTTTDVDGGYTLDTTGLKPPFLVSVQVDEDHILYSVSADADVASVVNISPLTDLIVRSWYSVQGVTITDAFADPAANPPPTPDEVQLISNVVVQVASLWLQQAGVDTTGFSPISTPFVADGTGLDQVLDQTDIDPDTGAITITDGAGTTQDSTVGYEDGTITVDNTTTGTGGSSSSTSGTVVTTTTDMQTALAGITTALNAFAAAANTKGAALKNTDLLPFLDKNLLDQGINKALFADSTATQFRDFTGIGFTVQNINSLDPVLGVADVNFSYTATQDSQTQSQAVEFFFKRQSDGSWRLYGDQLPAEFSVDSEMRINQGADAAANGPAINVDVRPIHGSYSEITISGGDVFSGTGLNKQDQTSVEIFRPDPSSEATVEVDRDEYFVTSDILVDLVPAGTELTLSLTPVGGGSPQTYKVHTNAFTTEPISITNLSGSALADAHLGGTLHLEWTLPKTFAIALVKSNAIVFTAHNSCEVEGPLLSSSATSNDIDFSDTTTCGGETITTVNVNLNVEGVNGERITVLYSFKDPTP